MRERYDMRCCIEYTEDVITACGRTFQVCKNCDRGINECTENECDHPKIEEEE